jgi:hypothetical protein
VSGAGDPTYRLSSCTGKAAYLTWSLAKLALPRSGRQTGSGRGRVVIYKCRFCHFWHVGSKTLVFKHER